MYLRIYNKKLFLSKKIYFFVRKSVASKIEKSPSRLSARTCSGNKIDRKGGICGQPNIILTLLNLVKISTPKQVNWRAPTWVKNSSTIRTRLNYIQSCNYKQNIALNELLSLWGWRRDAAMLAMRRLGVGITRESNAIFLVSAKLPRVF